MANQRVSQLAPITAPYLSASDLLLLADLSTNESKKLALSDLATFFSSNGVYTGSLYGSASYALIAGTASYLTAPTASYSLTSSWASYIDTASYASASITASYAITSSCTTTASYALTTNINSVANAVQANFANTASYLQNWEIGNGTASCALTSSYVALTFTTISYADTSSWATWASTASYTYTSSQALTASVANTASYLVYNGIPNGTASYAMFALSSQNVLQNFGTFLAITQSVSSSQLDNVSIIPTLGGNQVTEFEVYGTVNIPFTSSHAVNGRIELFVVDRIYGYSQSLDFSPITVAIGGVASPVYTGSLSYPFGLHGQTSLNGTYEVYTTASNGVFLEPLRNMRYKIASYSDIVTVGPAEPVIFYTYPLTAQMYYSSSLHPSNHYFGSSSQVVYSGSNDVSDLFIPPLTVMNMHYLWTLSGLVTMSMDGNLISSFGGMPSNCVSMSANGCALVELPTMTSSSIKWLNVPNNYITTPLLLPQSMSYLNVANNPGIVLPNVVPAGMTALIADGNAGVSVPSVLPNTLKIMSFATCSNLTTYGAGTFPANLQYWNSSGSTQLGSFPTTVPTGVTYFDVSANSMDVNTLGNIVGSLVSNGQLTGYLAFINVPNSQSAPSIVSNITNLITLPKTWTVVA